MTDLDYRAARQPDDPETTSGGGIGFVREFEDAVRENPIPAALIGMGLLWMFMGGNRTLLFGDREKSAGRMGDAAYALGQRSGSSISQAASYTGEALSNLGTRAGEMTRTAATMVSDAGSQISDAAAARGI
jgi:hypothetical protein